MFQRIAEIGEGLGLVVNSAWGGYRRMVEDGQFTWSLPFWQQPVCGKDRQAVVVDTADFVVAFSLP